MKLRVGLLLLLLVSARPALGTDNYSYKSGEYAIVSGGRSPNGHWSISAHGDGEYGDDNFDLYLMREPAHEKVMRLGIVESLDTGPLSIVGIWAADSTHVAVLNRTDRHVLDLCLFHIAKNKAQPIKVPLLIDAVAHAHIKPDVHYEFFSRLYRITWPKPNRVVVRELDTLDASKPVFTEGLEHYITLDRLGEERIFTEFSARAVYEITSKGELRVLNTNPLPMSNWPKTIIYSPHLRYDEYSGLHNTETTLQR